MGKLEELAEEKRVLSNKLHEVDHQIFNEKLRIVREKFGVYIGATVKGHDGKLYKVTSIEPSWTIKPWLCGNPQKKDSTFGTAIRNIYGDWVVIPEEKE
jgi:hypothetical protein